MPLKPPAMPRDSSRILLFLLALCGSLHPSPVFSAGFRSASNPRCPDIRSFAVDLPAATNTSRMVNVTIDPAPKLNQLAFFDDGNPVNITVVISRRVDVGPLCIFLNLTSVSTAGDPSTPPSTIGVSGLPLLVSEQDSIVYGVNESDGVRVFRFDVEVSGTRLGRALMLITALRQLTDDELTTVGTVPASAIHVRGSVTYHVRVIRPPMTSLSKVCLILLAIGMSTNMLSYACRLHTDVILHHIRHPFAILTGLGCQFIIMPIIAYLMGLAFDLKPHIRYALLILGCSPGGGPSNFITLLVRGDLYMSVIMTCVSNFLSIGMVPFWLFTLGAALMRADIPTYSPPMPWLALVIFGLLFSVPSVVGNLINRCVTDRTANIIGITIRVFGVVAVLIGLALTLYVYEWLFQYLGDDWRLIVAVTIFSHLGYVISLLIAVVGRRSIQTSMTIAVEAGIQSLPQMMFVLQLTCPQPESMLALPIAAVYLFNMVGATIVALFVLFLLDVRHRRQHDQMRFVTDGYDATPTITDSYSMSKTMKLNNSYDNLKFGGSGKSDSLGMRNGSFNGLAEKF